MTMVRSRFMSLGLLSILVVACASDSVDAVVEAPSESTATTAVEPTTVPTETEPETELAEEAAVTTSEGDGLFPTVVDARATFSDDTTWRVDVTLSSEYDSPARYADAWRVLDAEDNELGIRVLAHDHAGEQPFTRSTSVEIPSVVRTVYIEGREQINGWSGERFELELLRPVGE